MSRQTAFELWIRPLFRELDREQMLRQRPGLDLWDPAIVKTQATGILNVLQSADPNSVMPPMLYGGPWPAEWISVFKKWIADGFPQLALGTATAYQAIRMTPELVGVMATVVKPSTDYSAWLDRYFGPPKPGGLPDLVLYQEHRDSVPPPVTGEAIGYFRMPAGLTSLKISDTSGIQTVPINAAPPAALRQHFESRSQRTGMKSPNQ